MLLTCLVADARAVTLVIKKDQCTLCLCDSLLSTHNNLLAL